LAKIDDLELVPRGAAYIEGIAMVFEGRNYIVIFSAFVATLFSIVLAWYWGVVAGFLCIWLSNFFKTGKKLSEIVDIQPAEVRLDGPDLYVGNIYIMNVGLEQDRELIRKHSLGFVLEPKNKNSRVTIANLGQRQAILHDISIILGVYRDKGEPALVPMAKLDMNTGTLAVFLIPQDRDPDKAWKALQRVPVLESAVRMPSEAAVNKKRKA
jgi:hypothetical protein